MMENWVEEALQLLRRARNNMSSEIFLADVKKATEDANVAVPLMEAATMVSFERLVLNAGGKYETK